MKKTPRLPNNENNNKFGSGAKPKKRGSIKAIMELITIDEIVPNKEKEMIPLGVIFKWQASMFF